jgi:threonylcarbamoyladenosine tRNA methylthiotransferase MtaB
VIRIAYHTLGCKVNQYETEKIREALEGAGFATVPFSSSADAYVINTCTVTSVADAKSRAAVRRALRANPDAFIVVAGCYAELEPDSIRAIEGVDLIIPNDYKDSIADRIIARFANTQSPRPHPDPLPQEREHRPRLRTRAVVKVQDGCDQFCSYCIVPHARSAKRSRPLSDVLAEVRALAEFGYREVVLTGIRLGSYAPGGGLQVRGTASGTTCPGRTCLPELVGTVSEIEGVERIRLSSIEPWEVDEALLDAMQSPTVCRHLHIPLQSGDDGILARMNRPYTADRYRGIVSQVRAAIPGVGITTDVIVGFPGESDAAFANTCALIEEVGFSRLHVFRYSPRKGTPAALMPGQVPSEVKKQRAENLIELGKNAMRRFAESLVGETLQVLVENRAGRPNHLTGFTDNYVEVSFSGDAALAGRIVPVRIVGVDQDGCVGSRE